MFYYKQIYYLKHLSRIKSFKLEENPLETIKIY
jgi:hypothetical protein